MTEQLTQTKSFCNLLAIEKGVDPVGSAGNFEDALVVEMPLPWKYSFKEMDLPEEIVTLLELWLKRYQETGVYGHRPLLIAPDADYSKDGFRRVMFFSTPQGLFSEYPKTEYLVPIDKMGALIWAWYETPENLPQYEDYRQTENDSVRDILVCTHGAVDVACAKFGYPLYKHLRDNVAVSDTRIWRVSHFGGHLYAPTLMDMPKGDYWAYVDNNIGEQIVRREGDVQDLYNHYRGWSGLKMGFLQALERVCLIREGWQWQALTKRGEILKIDDSDEPQWADVRLSYMTPNNILRSYQAHVRIKQMIMSNPSSNDERQYPYPQYVVNEIEHLT
ncbi:MAG: sucrase ferredoxin [Aggregatilineales bacterium]